MRTLRILAAVFLFSLLACYGQTVRNNINTVNRISADVSNSTTSFANATSLSMTAAANTEYFISTWVVYTTSATTVGINLAVNGPATPTALACLHTGATAAGTGATREFNAYNTSGGTFTAAIAGNNMSRVYCYLKTGSTSGTFIIRFAAETTGSVTIKAGSFLEYREIT